MLICKRASVCIHHICINSLVPSEKKINIGNPGIHVNYWGDPPLILLVTWISNIGFCVPGNQQINANMVNKYITTCHPQQLDFTLLQF